MPASGTGVELVPVDEDVLERLVAAAVTGAAADEVTPPVTPGEDWSAERVAWLRRWHRDRRAGLDGPLGEETRAVLKAGGPVGAVRLQRTGEPGVLLTGLWLIRTARGHGTGRAALAAVLTRAAELGAGELHADTTAANGPAVAVLRRLGFRVPEPDAAGAVHAARWVADDSTPDRTAQSVGTGPSSGCAPGGFRCPSCHGSVPVESGQTSCRASTEP